MAFWGQFPLDAEMSAIQLTKAQQFWPLTDYLRDFGVPIGRYIEEFRLSKKMLDAPDIFIDEARFWRLSSKLAMREGFPDWGFRAGQQLDFSILGEFGALLLGQPTLKAALETFIVAISAETQSSFGLMQQGSSTWLMMRGYKDAPTGREVIELYDIAFMIKLVRNAAGVQWRPAAMHLQAEELPAGLPASELCGGPIRYRSTMTAIAIPTESLALPMSSYRSGLPAVNGPSEPDLADIDFATSLRLLLTGHIDECKNINDCADMVGLSSRTLQRRLAEQGTTFNTLLDQARFDLARQLLRDISVSVTDVAVELGYEDPANFSRAYRRWAGISPRNYRKTVAPQII